jgi:hypothetical protein
MHHHTPSMRIASLMAGLGLALVAVLAAFGVFGAVGALFTPGDAAKTAQDISESQALFSTGASLASSSSLFSTSSPPAHCPHCWRPLIEASR